MPGELWGRASRESCAPRAEPPPLQGWSRTGWTEVPDRHGGERADLDQLVSGFACSGRVWLASAVCKQCSSDSRPNARPEQAAQTAHPTHIINMSAFAALEAMEGDVNVEAVKEAQRQKAKEAKEAREREAAATKLRFEEMRTKGASNWADSDEDDDFFKSPPVSSARPAQPCAPARLPRGRLHLKHPGCLPRAEPSRCEWEWRRWRCRLERGGRASGLGVERHDGRAEGCVAEGPHR